MVRGRRNRSKATAANSLAQKTVNLPESILKTNDNEDNSRNSVIKIIHEDQQCYASPKRKESKVDNTIKNSQMNTRANKKTSDSMVSTNLTSNSILNGNLFTFTDLNKNNEVQVNCSEKHHHNRHHHHHHHHRVRQQKSHDHICEVNQKRITKFFSSIDQSLENEELNLSIDDDNILSNNNKTSVDYSNYKTEKYDIQNTRNLCCETQNDNSLFNKNANCFQMNHQNNNIKKYDMLTTPKTHLSSNMVIMDSDLNKLPPSSFSFLKNSLELVAIDQEPQIDTKDIKNNLFLQEPVLSLNIDKSLNQSSSIKINKTFEIDSVFLNSNLFCSNSIDSAETNQNSKLNSVCLNGFNKIVSLKTSPKRSISSDAEINISKHNLNNILNIDGNSNDSGVIADSGAIQQQNYQSEFNIKTRVELSPSKRRKPTTPHRILCPSPIKLPLVENFLKNTSISVNSNKVKNSFEHATNDKVKDNTADKNSVDGTQKRYPKSRRRLNDLQSENTSFKKIGDEKLNTATAKSDVEQKTILNSFKHPTAQNNCNKNGMITIDKKTVSEQIRPLKNQPQHKLHQETLTDFYPVRRSVRKTKTAVKEEMMRSLEQAILENREDGLKVEEFDGKGRGVITTRKFHRGEFVIEYVGDLIDMNEANKRENKYSLDENTGCYMYYFKHKNQQYCIDATAESGKLGRLVNHSRNGNLITKIVVVKSKPHLVLIAKEDIEAGVELTYDYGDRSKEALQHHPWLAL